MLAAGLRATCWFGCHLPAFSSFLVSADMAHALHPNYQERHDPTLGPKMHAGMVLKHNANQRYATNAVTAFFFRELGARSGLPTQEFAVRYLGCPKQRKREVGWGQVWIFVTWHRGKPVEN